MKAPKVYIRDSGMLHYLLGIQNRDELMTSPHRGNSFEGFMIEQIVALLQFGIENEVIDRGILLYKGSRQFAAASGSIRVVANSSSIPSPTAKSPRSNARWLLLANRERVLVLRELRTDQGHICIA